MSEKNLYDISEVCKMFDITSRTLRFYEEKGIIQSITTPFSHRRQYSKEQIDHIRDVLVLRTLGLSLKAITELQSQATDLKQTIISKRAEIYASINTKQHEINILNEALALINSGKNIFENKFSLTIGNIGPIEEIVMDCTQAIVCGNTRTLYQYLNDALKEYMPPDVYEKVRSDTLSPLGTFVSLDSVVKDSKFKNIIYHYVKYQNLGLKIKYVFHGEAICGLWLGYYEM
ncbi:MAG: MerR family transcriptional regulator [Clostridia bacterium]|nr:MerR family transcriptional regulator [Clostridia bacterium]